jgi:hypothetical protein
VYPFSITRQPAASSRQQQQLAQGGSQKKDFLILACNSAAFLPPERAFSIYKDYSRKGLIINTRTICLSFLAGVLGEEREFPTRPDSSCKLIIFDPPAVKTSIILRNEMIE